MILFMNKRDLFREKIKTADLTVAFPEYEGGCNYDNAVEFMQSKYESGVKDKNKSVFTHQTCATDTDNVKFVFESVKEIIIQNNLKNKKGLAGGGGDDMVGGALKQGATAGKGFTTPNTIYLVSLIFNAEDLVLCDKSRHVPFKALCSGQLKTDSNAFTWLLQLGRLLPDASEMKDDGNDKFPSIFARAYKALCKDLKLDSLGTLYDRPVFLKKARATLIIATQMAPEDKKFPRKFKYLPGGEVERSLYCRYSGMSEGDDIQQHDAGVRGMRYVKACSRYYDAMAHLVKPGVYIVALFALSTPTGFKILVAEEDRHVPPMVPCSETKMTEEDWYWIQGARLRIERGASPQSAYLGDDPYVTFVGRHNSFRQRYFNALERLKVAFGVDYDDFGDLYDSEYVHMDEHNNVQLVIYGRLLKSANAEILKNIDVIDPNSEAPVRRRSLVSNSVSISQLAEQKPRSVSPIKRIPLPQRRCRMRRRLRVHSLFGIRNGAYGFRFVWITKEAFEVQNYKCFAEFSRQKIYGRAVAILRDMASLPE